MTADASIRRGIAALRTGRPVRIAGEPPMVVLSVEAPAEALALCDPGGSARLLISGRRAAILGLANRRESADPALPVLLERSDWLDAAAARELADTGRDFARAPTGPLRPVGLDGTEASAGGALSLARSAGLLPALWVLAGDTPADPTLPLGLLERGAVPAMEEIARASLPLEGLPETSIVAFRASDDGQDHVALVVGAFAGRPPLVRMHSECLTGDVFGSLKCDCGPQLREALRRIGDEGGGILLYLRQEGRGIGLANKLRAYALQDRGLDTVDSNLRLGFADDERDYAHAAAMLRALGAGDVRLLTNNPAKVAGLENAGIAVSERVGHTMPTTAHNADYLDVKRRRSGHWD